jgi:hypothetical protein
VEVRWITEKCAKCSLAKVVEVLNWEEVKPVFANKGIETKQSLMEGMNEGAVTTCHCSSVNWKSPWVIGGGLVGLGLIIGLIVWLTTRKKKE